MAGKAIALARKAEHPDRRLIWALPLAGAIMLALLGLLAG